MNIGLQSFFRRRPILACLLSFFVGPLALTSHAKAEEHDGVYGRFDGEFVLQIAAGGSAYAFPNLVQNNAPQGAALLEGRLRFLDSVGLLGSVGVNERANVTGALGLDLRPLFLLRFYKNGEFGNRFPDLLLDSVGIDIGAAFGMRPDAIFFVGTGIDIPLAFVTEHMMFSLRPQGRILVSPADGNIGYQIDLTIGFRTVHATHWIR